MPANFPEAYASTFGMPSDMVKPMGQTMTSDVSGKATGPGMPDHMGKDGCGPEDMPAGGLMPNASKMSSTSEEYNDKNS